MATGRTLSRWTKIYAGGYDLSGYRRSVGALPWTFDAPDVSGGDDGCDNNLIGQSTIGPFGFTGLLDNTATSGLHTLMATPGSAWDIMVPIGMRAAPAQGDPVWMGKFWHKSYLPSDEGGAVIATLEFMGWDAADMIAYRKPWGTLVHALSAATAANSAAGYDDGAGAETTAGGYLMYQITAVAGTGTATISMDDSANNSTWLALSGATTGAIAHDAMPCAGIIQLGTTATVRQYLRWQLALDTITSVTFALAFVRGSAGLAN